MDYLLHKKRPEELSDRTKALNQSSMTIDVHSHMMFEFAIHKALGRKNIFDTYYLPELRRGGFQVIATTVGANSPCMCNMTDHLEFGCFEQIDMLKEEERNGASFKLCTTVREIEETVAAGKIAILLALEGTRALYGRDGEESMVMLRTFYELGLRVNCIAGGARTAFADGVGDIRAQAGLTTFGRKMIKEMNELGIVVDLTHMTDRCFFDSMEASTKPVLVSHVGAKAICNMDANLSDEKIRSIGQNGGVLGMEIVKTEIKYGSHESGELVTFDHVIDHIDHIAGLIGPEHICLGLDFDNFNLVHNVFRAMSPMPGSIEGFNTGMPKGDHMLNDPNNVGDCYVIAEYLCNRGYTDGQILGILGGNAWSLLREVMG